MADGPLVRYLRSSDPELDIIRRAVKGGWDLCDDKRREIVAQLMEMVQSPQRAVAVKAARILVQAVANDRQYELDVLRMLQRDQEDQVGHPGDMIDGTVKERLESLSTEDVHAILEQRAIAGAPLDDVAADA